jgi:proteasome lid subunit RPN8/RPN11
LYNVELLEEQGGFILRATKEDNFKFVPVKNSITGTKQAVALYVADIDEYNNNVALLTENDEWEIYASYHTHPLGMRAMPSHTDITKLFTSFPVNYIYAHGKELNRFDYVAVKDAPNTLSLPEWAYSNIISFNNFNSTKRISSF